MREHTSNVLVINRGYHTDVCASVLVDTVVAMIAW
jgi:hypothetical protein